ncbi:MAG: thioredoxin family protein [Cyanobacteria bacterium P01_F01_bin.150]
MVLTQSTMMPLGSPAPDFNLKDARSQQQISLNSIGSSQALLVMFICCHCPFVKHIETQLAQIGIDYQNADLKIVAISSNDIEHYPADSPEKMAEMAERLDFTFPFCFDESQSIAKAYTAACTPDFFLFNRDRYLIYRGQLDDSRPSNGKPVTGVDLRMAIDAVLSDRPITTVQHPSIGCNIKWKPNQEPAYFSS